MKITFLAPIFIACFVLISGCKQSTPNSATEHENKPAAPKNIVLVIGDGTGINQISALEFYKEGPIYYDDFPVVGLSKVSSTSLVTDSAAAGTAMACGQKTYNKAIGVDVNGQALPSITEYMAQKGGANGIISTSSITHATPACFFAHHDDRNDHEIIAGFLPQAPINFFAGPGMKYFNQRTDQVNLMPIFSQNNFEIDSILRPHPEAEKVGYLLAPEDMPKMSEGRGPFLQEAADLAIKHLTKNDRGFFMMLEASQVDWGGHDNDFPYMLSELIDLDDTLGFLLNFARRDQNTLIVVTGDHATGGFSLSADDDSYDKINPTFSSTRHNADWIPVFAYGPGAEQFGGVYENTAIFYKIKSLLDL